MLLSLFTTADDQAFKSAFDTVKESFVTGKYIADGKELDLPFAKQYQDFWGHYARKKSDAPETIENSDNVGHYNHFCNVVAAMAHIIAYAKAHPDKFLPENENSAEKTFSTKRKLDNMLTAFYHDIGKTIIFHRHAMEGKSLLAEPKASVRYRFETIFTEFSDCELSPQTLAVYGGFIGSHDMFGTIGTGENGILSMSGVISRLKSLYNGDLTKVKTAVFDLWLLNLADIIVSIGDFIPGYSKFAAQPWQETNLGNMDNYIEQFLSSYKGVYLLEDLNFALEIAGSDDPYNTAKKLAEENASQRFRRLTRQTLGEAVKGSKAFTSSLKDEVIKLLDSDAAIASVKEILRGEFGEEYGKRFGTMLQFDYALGFFLKLSGQAVKMLEIELTGGSFRTGWLYNQKIPTGNTYPTDFLDSYNASCIVNNYIMVLAGIFGEIHRLTADIESFNIEFDDAANRLTPSKADKLLFFDGAYRAGNARVLLMREIMLYKA
ncbi:MAG: hypothetical protein LBL80_02745 [Ruminococcus sp.]|jgi:hypothetical protein|nr:hypothetical protein [Ruminococcus sp.]